MSIKESGADDRSALGQLIDSNVKLVPGKIYHTSWKETGLARKWKDKSILTIDEVKEIQRHLKENQNGKKIFLHELLSGSSVTIPTLEIPERNPELEERMTALRNQLDEKEYQRMTRNVNSTSPYKSIPEDSISYQLKQMNSGIIAVIQFVISLAAAFLFGYSGVELFVGPLELAVRLLLGIASALIVGAAELYILVTILDGREEQKEMAEKKSN